MSAGDESAVTPRRLLAQWPVMLVVFVLVFGGLAYYIASTPVRYASNSVVAFQPQPGRADGRDLISLLIQTYPELVSSGKSVDLAAAAAGVSPSELRAGLDAQIPPLTLTMTIRTELGDARAAQVANQSLVDQVIVQGDKDPYLVATAISNANFDDAPAGVSRKLLYLVSLILAAGTALIAGLVAIRVRAAFADSRDSD